MDRTGGKSRRSLPSLPLSSPIPQLKSYNNTPNMKRRVEDLLGDHFLATMASGLAPRKRKRVSEPTSRSAAHLGSQANPYALSDDDADYDPPTKKGKTGRSRASKAKSEPAEPAEKRLRRYRAKPTQTFLTKLDRARTQRMIVLSRTRTSPLSEDIDIVGSVGNIYTVTIGHLPSCTCPDHRKGNECKHKVYALNTVLRAPERLVYQLALLSDELETIFGDAPPIPTDVVVDEEQQNTSSGGKNKRKPIEEGAECPICYMDMVLTEDLVWCKAACGNNMHKTCFDQWAASQRGQTVKCVYCRTPWEADVGDLTKVRSQGTVGDDGYVNVAEQFGMSGQRDYSSYHSYWVRRQFGMGY